MKRAAYRSAALLLALTAAGCTHTTPGLAPPSAGPAVHALYAPPAVDVQLETRGRLRPQYRADGIAGQPMPYDNAVESSLMLCSALGPLFGPCAGVLIGGAALAGITETVVSNLAAPGSAQSDGEAFRQDFAPDLDYASALSERIATASITTLRGAGDRAGPGASCTVDIAGTPPSAVHAVDVVQFEVEFEPGYYYRAVVVARLRTLPCPGRVVERRLAYRGQPVQLSRDAATARQRFEAEIDRAVAALGADVAAVLAGRPRPPPARD